MCCRKLGLAYPAHAGHRPHYRDPRPAPAKLVHQVLTGLESGRLLWHLAHHHHQTLCRCRCQGLPLDISIDELIDLAIACTDLDTLATVNLSTRPFRVRQEPDPAAGTPGERQLDRHAGSTDGTQSKRTPVDHPSC